MNDWRFVLCVAGVCVAAFLMLWAVTNRLLELSNEVKVRDDLNPASRSCLTCRHAQWSGPVWGKCTSPASSPPKAKDGTITRPWPVVSCAAHEETKYEL